MGLDMLRRPRRLRRTPAMRELLRETVVRPQDLIQPLFVKDGDSEPIAALPGQSRLSLTDLRAECLSLYQTGIRAVALFPLIPPALKDPQGKESLNPDTLILRAVDAIKATIPELLLITDIALDPYTTHGHDGILTEDGSDVDNDRSVARLAEMATLHAARGVDIVAPSDMMDGRVGAIRRELDRQGFTQTAILAYSAKFASAYYGPFREAVGSAQAAGTTLLNKETYQLDPANARQAHTECKLDEAEGADMLMVKPAGPYLDIIRQLREQTDLPVAAYQVSGEYAQLHAAAEKGWLNLRATRDESLLAIKRAGADMILTYFAGQMAREHSGHGSQGIEGLPDYDSSGSGI